MVSAFAIHARDQAPTTATRVSVAAAEMSVGPSLSPAGQALAQRLRGELQTASQYDGECL